MAKNKAAATDTESHAFFKTYVNVMLTLIVILLAVLVVMLAYAGYKINKTASSRVSDVDQQLKNINTSLQKYGDKINSAPSLPRGL